MSHFFRTDLDEFPQSRSTIFPSVKKFQKVTGEVYEINDEMLSELDEFENHPDYYIRKQEYVLTKGESERILVWMYFLPNFKKSLLELPFLSDYSSEGEHGLKYVTRYEAPRKDNVPYIIDVR